MAPLPGTRVMLLHGGWGETYELLHDSWLLAARSDSGHGGNTYGGDTVADADLRADAELPTEALRWVRVSTSHGAACSESAQSSAPAWRRDFYGGKPAAREMAAACPIGPGAALVFGGRGAHGKPLADAWRFELVPPAGSEGVGR